MVEKLLVDGGEFEVRIFEEELLDPVCADHERITLAVFFLWITLSLCETRKAWLASHRCFVCETCGVSVTSG